MGNRGENPSSIENVQPIIQLSGIALTLFASLAAKDIVVSSMAVTIFSSINAYAEFKVQKKLR